MVTSHGQALIRVSILLLGLLGGVLGSCDVGLPTIRITAEEFRFTPNHIELEAFHPVRLLISNQGREQHVFHSPMLKNPQVTMRWPANQGSRTAGNIPLHPGETVAVIVEFPAGVYQFRCLIRGHAGMEGRITVRAGPGR